MLSSLHIENVALIKEITLAFDAGFTVLTGETGAGKSIMIDALSLLCGGRSDRELIRTGAAFAFVEGAFDGFDDDTLEALAALGVYPDDDGFVFISRKVSADGRSVTKIGDRPTPASRLRTVAELLLDIHGQQDTLQLADTKKQLPLLDLYAKSRPLYEEYTALYDEYISLCDEIEELSAQNSDTEFRKEMLEFKLSELKKAKLKKGEESELEQLRKRLRAADRIARATAESYSLLYGKDGSASEQLSVALAALEGCFDAMPEFRELAERLSDAKCEIDDVADSIRSSNDGGEDSEARLDETEKRLETITNLKRRFACDYDGLLAKEAELSAELARIENSDGLIAELEARKQELQLKLFDCGEELSALRKKAARRLEAQVAEELCLLDMPSVKFTVSFTPTEPSSTGCDSVEFLISPNAGETAKPLAKIASGGELARIMLAFKSTLAGSEMPKLMVFDEIDTGVSGKTAQKTGLSMRILARREGAQVFCVTHSAQIACLADTHLKVSKSEQDGRTESAVRRLTKSERVTELARIIGGIDVGEATLNAARELLDNAQRL